MSNKMVRTFSTSDTMELIRDIEEEEKDMLRLLGIIEPSFENQRQRNGKYMYHRMNWDDNFEMLRHT